jgi:hypothetical protein
MSQHPEFIGDASYTFEMQHRIMQVNGEDIDSIMVQRYVDNMIGGDSSYYHQKINDGNSFGVQRVKTIDCEDANNPIAPCNGISVCAIRGNDEFFRTPDID